MHFNKNNIKVKKISKVFYIYSNPFHKLLLNILPKFCLGSFKKKFNYRSHLALTDISFNLKNGDSLGIIGDNGAGKSTLLQIICGILNPSKGLVNKKGKVAAILELGAGFNQNFTGKENIFLYASLHGKSRKDIQEKYQEIVNFADIGDFINLPVRTYSSGMVVRLAFSIIAHLDIDILVVDEALAVGDAFFVQKCMKFIDNFRKDKILIFVSHDMNAIARVTNKSIWLKNGRIAAQGKTSEVIDKYHADIVNKTFSSKIKNEDIKRKKIDQKKIVSNFLDMNQISAKAKKSGEGNISILSSFITSNGIPKKNFTGGETIKINYLIHSKKYYPSILFGFTFKDKFGQKIFEDNNLKFSKNKSTTIDIDKKVLSFFEFSLPLLKKGEYLIDVAVAYGDDSKYVHQEWIYNALKINLTPLEDKEGILRLSEINYLSEEIN